MQITLYAQPAYTLSGTVRDEAGHTLPGASIVITPGRQGVISDEQGAFILPALPTGEYAYTVSFLGYESFHQHLFLDDDMVLDIILSSATLSLQEVVVECLHDEERKKDVPLAIEVVNDEYLKQNRGGSLMQSLERLPGVTTIDIGSGQSKPVIRGLGFNRVVVVENNIKHEAQQWGADHGLEIDQFATDNIEVIKGPASLQYGSDAIGGIIHVKNNELPAQYSLHATTDIIAKSNNNLLGTSLSLMGRRKWLFAGLRATVTHYGDYRVPTDTVVIYPDTYAYKVPLHKQHMRNTAGQEHNYHGTIGMVKDHFKSRFYLSQTNSKGGFFANAHGLEPLKVDTEFHDQSARDIQLPHYRVSHSKISTKTQWTGDHLSVEFDAGFQRNFRQERSEYTSHGYMPPVFPDSLLISTDLEREFKKEYYAANLKIDYNVNAQLVVNSGINTSHQRNNINGRGFIIPAYQQSNHGVYLLGKYTVSSQSAIRIGGRYDFGRLATRQYSDWFFSPDIEDNDTIYRYLERARALEREFSNLSWSIGYNYTPSNWILKLNVGKSFRMPTPQELVANGINYHYFRYEQGNTDLSPEVSWQLDAGAEYHAKRFAIGTSPFVNVFSNYIYLNPTSTFKDGFQVFNYTQSQVFRYGTEVHAHYNLLKSLRLGLIGEHVYSLQLSGDKQGYTLPYSPPASAIINVKYLKPKIGFLENIYISVDYRLTTAQNSVVPPENPTPAYSLINLGIGGDIKIRNQKLALNVQVQNLLNTTYLNHTSFYRLMNVPEPGRNFVLNISIPITANTKTTH